MKKTLNLLWTGVFFVVFTSCQKTGNENYQEVVQQPELYHQTVKKLTDVIVHDIFSPPVASRIYAYPSIAAFEAMVHSNPAYISMAEQLNGLKPLPQPEEGQKYAFELASMRAFLKVGR